MDLQGVNSQAVARSSSSFQISKPSTGPTSLSKERNKSLRFGSRHPLDRDLAIAIHPLQSPSPASMGWRPFVLSSFTLLLAAQQGKVIGSSVVLSNPEERIWQAKSLGFANNRLLLSWQESQAAWPGGA